MYNGTDLRHSKREKQRKNDVFSKSPGSRESQKKKKKLNM